MFVLKKYLEFGKEKHFSVGCGVSQHLCALQGCRDGQGP